MKCIGIPHSHDNVGIVREVSFEAGKRSCDKCPDLANSCDGDVIKLDPGYWRWTNVSFGVYECPLADGCKAGNVFGLRLDETSNQYKVNQERNSSICNEGYYGYYCSKCDFTAR